MKNNLKQKALDAVTLAIENNGEVQGFLEICEVEIEWMEGKAYFGLVLRFPNGTFRRLYIHETALLTKSGGTRFTSYADAEEAEVKKISGE